jgi:hypothetical protein
MTGYVRKRFLASSHSQYARAFGVHSLEDYTAQTAAAAYDDYIFAAESRRPGHPVGFCVRY